MVNYDRFTSFELPVRRTEQVSIVACGEAWKHAFVAGGLSAHAVCKRTRHEPREVGALLRRPDGGRVQRLLHLLHGCGPHHSEGAAPAGVGARRARELARGLARLRCARGLRRVAWLR